MSQDLVIDNLKKVKVSLSFEPEAVQEPTSPVSLEFIFGIGTEGLCDFERHLATKRRGDQIHLTVDPGKFPEVFGHLICQLPFIPHSGEPLNIRGWVDEVQPAENREVVKALAGLASCDGHHGDGECGCH